MGLSRYTYRTLVREIVFILCAAVYCVPFYLVIAVALQTTEQNLRAPFTFPWPPHFGNFATAWNTGGRGGPGPKKKGAFRRGVRDGSMAEQPRATRRAASSSRFRVSPH